jgi:hypothetical protein
MYIFYINNDKIEMLFVIKTKCNSPIKMLEMPLKIEELERIQQARMQPRIDFHAPEAEPVAEPMDIDEPAEEEDNDKCMVIQPIFYNNIRGVWDYDGNDEECRKIRNSLLHSVNGKYVEFRTYFLVHYSDNYFEEMEKILKGVLGGEEIQLAFDLIKIIDGKYNELDLEDPEYVAELDDIINNDYYYEDEAEDLDQE